MSQSSYNNFFTCLFTATIAWYSSMLLAFFFSQLHVAVVSPSNMYSMYWSACFDEFCQHNFYMLFVIQSILWGFFLERMPRLPAIKAKRLINGTLVAILLIPLAAVGVNGVKLTQGWPTGVPPLTITAGILWFIPGIVILIVTFYRAFANDEKVSF